MNEVTSHYQRFADILRSLNLPVPEFRVKDAAGWEMMASILDRGDEKDDAYFAEVRRADVAEMEVIRLRKLAVEIMDYWERRNGPLSKAVQADLKAFEARLLPSQEIP